MGFLPKGRFTWFLLAVAAYLFFTYKPSFLDKTASDSDPLFEITSKVDNASALEKPVEAIIKKIASTNTGKAVVRGVVEEAIREQYGNADFIAVSAEHTNQAQFIDMEKGTGDIANCSSTVTIHYDSYIETSIVLDSTRSRKPLTITLGKGEHMIGLDQRIEGMRVGGLRRIAIPPAVAHDKQNQPLGSFETKNVIIYEVELVATTPAQYPPNLELLFTDENIEDSPKRAMCGSTVTIEYDVKDANGNKLNNKKLSATFMLGGGNVPVGLEQSILGMTKGSTRSLILTPQAAITPNENTLPKDPELKSNRNYIFNVTLIETN